MKEVEIEYPEIEIQTKIVKVLDKIVHIMNVKRQEIDNLNTLIKSRFVEMFGDAVANPMHWPVKKLKDLSVQINQWSCPKRWLGKLC